MRATLRVALLAALAAAGCAEKIDLATGLEVQDTTTGWYSVGVVDGQNKIVPIITFKLKNISSETLKSLQVNAVFRRNTDPQEDFGSGYMTVVKSEGLAPGAISRSITLQAPKGYTGTETPAEMLRNSNFVDGNVDLLAKYSSGQWQSVSKQPIARTLFSQ